MKNRQFSLWPAAAVIVLLTGECADVQGEPRAPGNIVTRKADLDGDGWKEATIRLVDDKVLDVTLDKDNDGRPDTVVYYREGFRDYAEIDSDFDGRTDTNVRYYFTGVPALISTDTNGDGQPDRWKYLKNGFVYKRESDRNLDGQPDHRLIFEVGSDLRPTAGGEKEQAFERQSDDDYNGVFEKVTKGRRRFPDRKKAVLTAGDTGEQSV